MTADAGKPTAYSGEAGPPKPVALVVLPFTSEMQAVEFANMVRGQHNQQSAIVTAGTAYEWVIDLTEDNANQVVEFTGGWEAFEDPARPDTVILQRGPNVA